MTRKTLIIANMSAYQDWKAGVVNRNAHILAELVERGEFAQVIAVDFLPFTPKKKLKFLWRERPFQRTPHTLRRGLTVQVRQDPEKTGLLVVSALNPTALRRVLHERVDSSESDLVVWSYNPLLPQIFDWFPNATTVFDAVDNWSEHSAYAARREQLQKNYRQIGQRADHIFTVSEQLLELFQRRPNVHFVPNGVDAEHFGGRSCAYSELHRGKPLVTYHGVIQSRLNFVLLEQVVQLRPELDFVLAGPIWRESQSDMKRLQALPNVRCIGPVPYARLPQFLACADICMVPHRVDEFTQTMNPLKLYECIAAGKPVVSTPVAGADQFQDLIRLAVSAPEFAKALDEELHRDSDALRGRRRHLAEQQSWQGRVELMLEIINRQPPTE